MLRLHPLNLNEHTCTHIDDLSNKEHHTVDVWTCKDRRGSFSSTRRPIQHARHEAKKFKEYQIKRSQAHVKVHSQRLALYYPSDVGGKGGNKRKD